MRATHGTKVPRFRSLAAAFGAAIVLAQPLAAAAQANSTGATRVLDGISEPARVLDVPATKPAWTESKPRHSMPRRHGYATLARPVLAGIKLEHPLSGPFPRPRPIVPAPAYLFDSFFADLTTPPPPVVCHREGWHAPLACRYDID